MFCSICNLIALQKLLQQGQMRYRHGARPPGCTRLCRNYRAIDSIVISHSCNCSQSTVKLSERVQSTVKLSEWVQSTVKLSELVQSTVKLLEWVQSTVKAAQKYSQSSDPSVEWTHIAALQFAPNWNGLQQYNVGGVTHAMK